MLSDEIQKYHDFKCDEDQPLPQPLPPDEDDRRSSGLLEEDP